MRLMKKSRRRACKSNLSKFFYRRIEKKFESYAFNYQQGTRLQWLNNESSFLMTLTSSLNHFAQNNVTNKEVTNLSSPI